jgi:hypothetical protein
MRETMMRRLIFALLAAFFCFASSGKAMAGEDRFVIISER